MPRLFLLDGTALAYRSHYALARSGLTRTDGKPTGATYGFTIDDGRPTASALGFDGSRVSRRLGALDPRSVSLAQGPRPER